MDDLLRQNAAAELLESLAAEYYLEPVAPDEVTAEMLAARLKCTQKYALDILKDEERAGHLTSRDARAPNGYRVKAYRKA